MGGPTMKPLAELMELLMQQPEWTLERYRPIEDEFDYGCYIRGTEMKFADTPQEAIHRALVAAGILTLEDE